MKNTLVLLCIFSLSLFSCTRIKVERFDPPTPLTEKDITDNDSLVIGSHLGMEYVKIDRTVELLSNDPDSAGTTIDIAGHNITIYTRRTSTAEGIYFKLHDNHLKEGYSCATGQFRQFPQSVAKFGVLCSFDYSVPQQFLTINHTGEEVPLYESAGSTTITNWTPDGIGNGYLALRYLDSSYKVKYAWIQLTITSTTSVHITDYAF